MTTVIVDESQPIPPRLRSMMDRSVAAGEPQWAHALIAIRPVFRDARDERDASGDAVRVVVRWNDDAGDQEMPLTTLCRQLSADPVHPLVPTHLELICGGTSPPPVFINAAALSTTVHLSVGGVALPRPLVAAAFLHVWDSPGVSAAMVDTQPTSGTPTGFDSPIELRIALGRALMETTIPGLQGRAKQALRALLGREPRNLRETGDVVAQYAAGAVAEYFRDGRAGRDGGPPLQGFEGYVIFGDRVTPVVAPSGEGGPDRRRARLNETVVKALEDAAFGGGLQSPRARRPMVSIDWTSEEGAPYAETLMDDDDIEDAVLDEAEQDEARVRLEALRRELRPDERALLDAKLADPEVPLGDLARTHGWNPSDVEATWRRITRRARSQNS